MAILVRLAPVGSQAFACQGYWVSLVPGLPVHSEVVAQDKVSTGQEYLQTLPAQEAAAPRQ